jgi:hypothetical protein
MSRKPHAIAFSAAAAVAVLLAAPTPAPAAGKAYKVVEVKDGGTIRGVVRISEVPTLLKVSVFKDNEKGCGDKERDTERLIAGDDRALGNAIVYLKSIDAGKDWPEKARSEDRTGTIDQHGCKYVPHVQWVRKETQMVVLNSDGADHNIHAYRGSLADTQFNISSAPGSKQEDNAGAFLEQPAKYIVKCDIHPWMSAYVHAVDHPYYDVTSAKAETGRKAGEFVLENVPPGTYVVVLWHEGMLETPVVADGKIAAYSYSPDVEMEKPDVKVEAGKTATVDFEVAAPKK